MINDAGKYEVKNFKPHRSAAAAMAARFSARGAVGGADTDRSACGQPGSNKETTVLGKNINVLSWGGAETDR